MFRWFFKKRTQTTPPPKSDEDDYDSDLEPEFLTYTEAELLAQQEALRDLQKSLELITYVHYSDGFDDFCRVRIQFEAPDRGWYCIFSLPISERLESESIEDSKIAALWKAGRRVNAVRLHRFKYNSSLADAMAAIKAMESHS